MTSYSLDELKSGRVLPEDAATVEPVNISEGRFSKQGITIPRSPEPTGKEESFITSFNEGPEKVFIWKDRVNLPVEHIPTKSKQREKSSDPDSSKRMELGRVVTWSCRGLHNLYNYGAFFLHT